MSATGTDRRVELVEDDGRTHELVVDPGETILEAADAAAVSLPYGCREGRCSSCTARLLEGAVEYATEPRALPDGRRAEGFVLLCSARPTAPCRIEVGRHVRAAAFPSLWGTDG